MSDLAQVSILLLALSIAAALFVAYGNKKNKKTHHN